jgi:3-dehydroquinate synthase class II
LSRSCTVCSHPDSVLINEALVIEGQSNRALTRQYDLSKDAVRRHREHIPQLLVKASQAMEVVDADDLLAKVEELRQKAMDVLAEAEDAHDHRVVLAAIDRASKQLELLAKLLGEISDAPQINLTLNPEWLELRAVIVGALEPYSDARGAVLRAIEGAPNGRA